MVELKEPQKIVSTCSPVMQINSDEKSEVEGHLLFFCFLLRLVSFLREIVISTRSVLVDNCYYPTEVFLRFLNGIYHKVRVI